MSDVGLYTIPVVKAPDAPSPFFKGTTLQYAWDSTSVNLLMECARKYYLTMIENWRKKDQSVHLTFGGHFATAMEVYAHAKARGADHEEALDAVVEAVLELTWVRPLDPDGNKIMALDNGHPWTPDGDPKKNRDSLLRTCIWYFEEYKDDQVKTIILPDGRPATELTFKFESGIPDPYGGFYLLTGHLDRLVDYAGEPFVMDQKTTGQYLSPYFFKQFDMSSQMSQYTTAGKIVYNVPVKGVIIDAAAILVGSTTFGRSITMRTPGQLKEWHANIGQWLQMAEIHAASGNYPMNLTSCTNYGGCVFAGICNKDPSVRGNYLETDFEKRVWNPLAVR